MPELAPDLPEYKSRRHALSFSGSRTRRPCTSWSTVLVGAPALLELFASSARESPSTDVNVKLANNGTYTRITKQIANSPRSFAEKVKDNRFQFS